MMVTPFLFLCVCFFANAIDIVLVLDYKPNSSTVPAKRGSTIIYIPKQSIKRADCDDVKRNFLKLLNKNNDSSYSHRPHRLKISPVIITRLDCVKPAR